MRLEIINELILLYFGNHRIVFNAPLRHASLRHTSTQYEETRSGKFVIYVELFYKKSLLRRNEVSINSPKN